MSAMAQDQIDWKGPLGSLLRATTHLRKVDKEMPMSRLLVLMLVARQGGKDGALVRDIIKASGMNQSTVARTLAHLGSKQVRGNAAPLELVDMHPDPEDPRRVRCHLTPKGRTLLAELENIM